MDTTVGGQAEKSRIRAEVQSRRKAQAHKEELSRQILARLADLPEYAAARTVLFYINLPVEVQTQPFLPGAWQDGKTIAVPWCQGDTLELFRLQSFEELTIAGFGLLEPRPELRLLAERRVEPAAVDLAVVPGVAFDPRGGRLGHGKGYFDQLLKLLRPETPRVALAFQCQVVPAVPMLPHDVFMTKVITEETTYEASPAR